MLLTGIAFEIAPTPQNDPACRRCRARIDADAPCLRIVIASYMPDTTPRVHYHGECAIDLDAPAALRALTASPRADADYAALVALARERAAGVDALRAGRAPADVVPARDAQGRPRVWIFIAGSAMSWGKRSQADFDRIADDGTWRSSKREYRFVGQWTDIRDPDEDPSQPVIAAVFAATVKTRLMHNQLAKMAAWRVRGLPAPVLWLVGAAHPEDLDDRERELREFADGAGYRGDECVVLRADAVDAAALDALVAVLDEAAPWGVAVATTPAAMPTAAARPADALARVTGVLDALVREGRAEAIPAAIEQCHAAFERAPRDERHAFARVLAACLDRAGEWTHAALRMLGESPEDDAVSVAVAAWLRATLVAEARKSLSARDVAACDLLRAWQRPELAPTLVEGYRAARTEARRDAIRACLRGVHDGSTGAALRAWALALPKADGRRARALQLARALVGPKRQNSRALSTRMVTGPSTTASTRMSARKTPVATVSPPSRKRAQKRS